MDRNESHSIGLISRSTALKIERISSLDLCEGRAFKYLLH